MRGKGLWRKEFAEQLFLSSEWKTKRVREDESGDSENGEDDELSYVIRCESEGVFIWRFGRMTCKNRPRNDL